MIEQLQSLLRTAATSQESALPEGLIEKLSNIRLLATDVDGVLTNGRIAYSSAGEEIKFFDIKDGLGIKLLQRAGIEVAIITGRESAMVNRRAAELGIKHLIQGREDKRAALTQLVESMQNHSPLFDGLDEHDVWQTVAYVGDDLPDLGAFRVAGLALTVADAHQVLIDAADAITTKCGGQGALRQICDAILLARGDYSQFVESF